MKHLIPFHIRCINRYRIQKTLFWQNYSNRLDKQFCIQKECRNSLIHSKIHYDSKTNRILVHKFNNTGVIWLYQWQSHYVWCWKCNLTESVTVHVLSEAVSILDRQTECSLGMDNNFSSIYDFIRLYCKLIIKSIDISSTISLLQKKLATKIGVHSEVRHQIFLAAYGGCNSRFFYENCSREWVL